MQKRLVSTPLATTREDFHTQTLPQTAEVFFLQNNKQTNIEALNKSEDKHNIQPIQCFSKCNRYTAFVQIKAIKNITVNTWQSTHN